MNDYKTNTSYQSMSKFEKAFVDLVIENLNSGYLYTPTFRALPPASFMGGRYGGNNIPFLMMVQAARGYTDNRWITFNQMCKKKWSFKRNEDGVSMGKDAGVPVQFFTQYDRKTKKQFDEKHVQYMTKDEREKYMRDNVTLVQRTFIVFNCCLVDGVPDKTDEQKKEFDELKINEAEKIICLWDETECTIKYGDIHAAYLPAQDRIVLPARSAFKSISDFYCTVLHEMAHAACSPKRLNIGTNSCDKYSEEYAFDELVAEFSAFFTCGELNIGISKELTLNSAAYIDSWANSCNNDPSIIIKAATCARKVSKYILSKINEKQVLEAEL